MLQDWIKKLIEQLGLLAQQVTVLIVALLMTAFALLGWGHLALRVVRVHRPTQPDTGTVWLGFGFLLGILEFLQLIIPIDWKVSLGVLLVGFIGGAKSIQWFPFIKALFQRIKSYPLVSLAVFIILLIWCLRAMGVVNNYDSGLYHFQTIRWINEYPVVPGLGNLHWRLAFNQSYFNFLAVLNIYPYWNRGYALGGLFLLLLSALTLYETSLRQNKAWKWVFSCGLFIYFGYVASGVANPAPDGIIGLIQLAVFLLLFQIFSLNANEIERASDQLTRVIATVLTLCLSIVTIKLTGALFAISCILILTYVCRALFIRNPIRWLILAVVLILFALLHLGRGYLLSGYPLFPSQILGVTAFPWSMPLEFVKFEADLIMSWARMPGLLDPTWALSNWEWVPIWFNVMPVSAALLLVFVIISAPITTAILIVGKIHKLHIKYVVLYLPIFTTLLFWFLTAPDLRFLGSIMVLSVLLTIWLWIQYLQVLQTAVITSVFNNKNLVIAVVLVVSLVSMKLTGFNSLALSGWANVPSTQVHIKDTASGFTVQVPLKGEQCWGVVLPCVPIFNKNLTKQDNFFYKLNRLGLFNDFYFTTQDLSTK